MSSELNLTKSRPCRSSDNNRLQTEIHVPHSLNLTIDTSRYYYVKHRSYFVLCQRSCVVDPGIQSISYCYMHVICVLRLPTIIWTTVLEQKVCYKMTCNMFRTRELCRDRLLLNHFHTNAVCTVIWKIDQLNKSRD